MATIEEVVAEHGSDLNRLTEMLLVREDGIADVIRLAGMQFGLFPGIVSKVLMDAGLGTPKSEAEVEYINAQFAEALAALQRMIDEQGGGAQ